MGVLCPHCGKPDLRKNGFTKSGIQRWRCKCTEGTNVLEPIIVSNDINKDLVEAKVGGTHLAKKLQRAQDTNRIERKAFRETARIENAMSAYIEALKDVISQNSLEFKVKNKSNTSTSDSVGFIHLSDLHFNELVDIVGNNYDFKVAAKRLRLLATKSLSMFEARKIDTVYLVITGDLLNSDRRLDEVLAMATNRASATFLAIKILTQFVLDISSHFNVKVVSITGNESRIREEYTQLDSFATDNFDFMIYEGMKLLFENSKAPVEFISGNTLDYILSVNNTNILITHGHRLGKMGHNDLSKVITKWAKKGIIINFVMCGHLHETNITDTLLRAGSLVGNNAYADAGLNLHSRASQNIYIIDKEGNLDAMRVDLQSIPEWLDGHYDIDDHLDAYNSKSVDKLKDTTSILQIVI